MVFYLHFIGSAPVRHSQCIGSALRWYCNGLALAAHSHATLVKQGPGTRAARILVMQAESCQSRYHMLDIVQFQPKSTCLVQLQIMPAKYGQESVKSGPVSTESGTMSGKLGPNPAKCGPSSTNLDRRWPGIGQVWPDAGQIQLELTQVSPTWGRNRPCVVQSPPKCGPLQPILDRSGPTRAKLTRTQPNLARSLGQRRPTSTKSGPSGGEARITLERELIGSAPLPVLG